MSNYGTSNLDQSQRDGYMISRERNWRLEMYRYPAIGTGVASGIICLLAILGLMRNHVPLVVLIICFSIGISGIAICCYCICTFLFRWRTLTSDEEQDRRNPRSKIQNPDIPGETEGLFRSNTERVYNLGTSRQSEELVANNPEIEVQNPDSSHQTKRLFTSRYQNPGSSLETAGTLV